MQTGDQWAHTELTLSGMIEESECPSRNSATSSRYTLFYTVKILFILLYLYFNFLITLTNESFYYIFYKCFGDYIVTIINIMSVIELDLQRSNSMIDISLMIVTYLCCSNISSIILLEGCLSSHSILKQVSYRRIWQLFPNPS